MEAGAAAGTGAMAVAVAVAVTVTVTGTGLELRAGAEQASPSAQLTNDGVAPAQSRPRTRSRRVQNKMRQHTLETARANPPHAQQIGRLPEAFELRAERHDRLG